MGELDIRMMNEHNTRIGTFTVKEKNFLYTRRTGNKIREGPNECHFNIVNVKKKIYNFGLFFIFSHIRNYIFWSNENNSMFLQPNWSIEVFFKKCFNSHKFCLCIHFNISIIEPISDF